MEVSMANVSRLPIRYGVIVMGCAVGLAAAVWTIAFLVQLRIPSQLASGGDIAASSIALACVLTLLLMIESVAHERLVSDAFNPLAQRDSERLRINQRVVQNTLEQLPLFAAGIVMICWLFPIEAAFRATLAATIVWVLSRWVFWAGYHFGPQHRVGGLVGSAQSMIVLLVALATLGARMAGSIGAVLVVSIFSLGEVIVVLGLRKGR
jgi:MAPEG family